MQHDWLDTAKTLPCGSKIKVVHCGNSPSMLISHSEKGYSCHCFRCQDPEAHRFVPHGERSISEIQRHKQELLEHKNKPPHIPLDYTLDIPVQYAYFLKYGISIETARAFGIGYSEFFHRIVIPIYGANKTELKAVHLRAISPEDKPKYLNLGRPYPDTLYTPSKANLDGSLVIVEDVLSAIKVRMAGFNSVALNGSSITDTQALILADCNDTRYVWLDGDVAGIKGARDVVKQLKLQATEDVRMIRSEKDPKAYNKDEIANFIKEAYKC